MEQLSKAYIPDVVLPKEVVAVLPADPYAQLELAHRLTCYAYTQKVRQMEAENQQLRETINQSQAAVKAAERKGTLLQVELQDLQTQNALVVEKQHQLTSEKSALLDTIRRLTREISKLENFKSNLRMQLEEDVQDPYPDTQKAPNLVSAERLLSEYMCADALPSLKSPGAPYKGDRGRNGLGMPSTPHFPSPESPGRSNRAAGTANAALSSSTPAPASAMRVDGKEFFRQARSRLSYDDFSRFLSTVKELNSGRASRQDALHTAQSIFGIEHADLYGTFESLMSRQLSPG